MTHPDFARAAAHITAEAVRDALVDLVDIASPTGHEAGVAHYLVERMRKSGLDTDLPLVDAGRPNAVGHLRGRGDGLNLLFTGHMDTSYSGEEEHLSGDGFKPRGIVRDGWVWGLGANNMKSGLACALVAIEAIAKAGIRLDGDISFGGVVGEIEKTAIEEFQGVEYSGYGIGSRHPTASPPTSPCSPSRPVCASPAPTWAASGCASRSAAPSRIPLWRTGRASSTPSR